MADTSAKEFDLETFLPYLVVRAALRLGNASDQLFTRRYNLTRRMWRVLGTLSAEDGQGVTQLAQHTATEISTLSRLLDMMEDEGLVLRRRERERTRSVQIFITRAGRALFKRTLPETIKTFELLTEEMSKEEVSALIGGLHKIYARIERVEDYIAELLGDTPGRIPATRGELADDTPIKKSRTRRKTSVPERRENLGGRARG
jgi:DNA-binding MarR family transcriptional regulator